MFGVEWALLGKRVGGFFGKVVKSPWFWAVLILAAVGGGTAYYLKHDKAEAVKQATNTADQNATNKSFAADSAVNARVQEREQKLIILHDQTVKDYANARATLQAQPAAERDAPAPRILIDTLNQLDRLRGERDAGAVPDAEVPVG